MTVKAGLAPDEFGIEASQLNQTHVGLSFGVNFDDGTIVYGRIASIHIERNDVLIRLTGSGSEDDHYSTVHMKHHEQLFFTRYSHERQVLDLLEKLVESKP